MSQPLGERELATLIRERTPQLFGVVRAFTHDDAESEDILQDVWMIVAVKSHHRAAGIPLGAWLHTVTLNQARSHHRRARRRAWLSQLWSAPVAVEPGAGTRTSLAEELERAALWRAIADLPSLQRQVVLLRIVDELSTRETAERLDRAEGTIKVSLHRALASLRRAVGTRDDARGTDRLSLRTGTTP